MTQIVAAEGEDRVHHQRRLHAHRRAVSRINPLYRARDETIGDIAQAGAAIAFGQRRAEQSELPQLAHDFPIEPLLQKRARHARLQPFLRKRLGSVPHQPLFVRKLRVEAKGIVMVEGQYRWFMDSRFRSEEHTSELQSLMRNSY